MNIENRFFTGLGDALRNIRHERRLSYNDMPDIVKMSPETLMKMEAGSYLKTLVSDVYGYTPMLWTMILK